MGRMTSKERVLAAADLRPVDRMPVMLWLEANTTLKIATGVRPPRRRMNRAIFNTLDHLSRNLPNESLRRGAPLLAHLLQAEYLLELGADIVDFYWGFPPLWLRGAGFDKGSFYIEDLYGIKRAVAGDYLDLADYPCKTPEDLDRYRFPDLSHPIHYSVLRNFKRLHPDVAVACWIPGVQDHGQGFMGMENLYLWAAMYPDHIERFFRKLAAHSLQIIRGAMRAGADVIMIGDDYGTQQSLLMSKRMWERYTFPCLRRQCEEIHRFGGRALLHSCGSVMPLLDKFVEAGVDMLHPLQPVGENSFERAVEEFGDSLCFVTGMDVQKMPEMPPGEVRGSIAESVRIGSRGGGMVLCHTNFLQQDTPVENLEAMFETIEDLKKGRLRDNADAETA